MQAINGNNVPANRPLIDHCKGILVVVARGMFSLLGALNYETVVLSMATAAGEMFTEACWCNDVMHTISLRGKIKDAFEKGMKTIPSMAPAQPNQIPQENQVRQ